ncbi:MAG: YHYH protein [Magnetovibrionaceae bacterium]
MANDSPGKARPSDPNGVAALPAFSRRSFLLALGLAPGAMVVGPGRPWALNSQVTMRIAGEYRLMEANGIPDHATGSFPNRRNPHRIEAQRYRFRVPVTPVQAENFTAFQLGPFGLALNGVPFDPFTAEFWNRNPKSGWRLEAVTGKSDLGLDDHNAHVQPNGAYHYHGIPKGLIKQWSPDSHSAMIGFAADGFPIYVAFGFETPDDPESPVRRLKSGWRLREGKRGPNSPGGSFDGTYVEDFIYKPGPGDLDMANGRYGATPEFPAGTYAYFLTDTFPFIPRHFRGRPDRSFPVRFELPDRLPGPKGGGPGGRPGGGPGGFRRPEPGRRDHGFRPPPRPY